MEKKEKQSKKTKSSKEKIVFVNDPKFDSAVLKILTEHIKAFRELAK